VPLEKGDLCFEGRVTRLGVALALGGDYARRRVRLWHERSAWYWE
jgi:hypothetical protein